MAKKMRARGVHTAVVLQPDVLESLRKSPRGVSNEIRHRINRTLYQEQFDLQTRELAADIMEIAAELHRQTGVSWYRNRSAHEALIEAVRTWLDSIKPPIDGTAATVSDLFVGDAVTRGQSVAQSWQRIKAEMAKSNREILGRHEGGKS